MKCKVEGCTNKNLAKGFCGKHYMEYKRHGTIRPRHRKMPNEIVLKDNYAILKVYDKYYNPTEVLIDVEVVDKISKYKWHLKDNNYINSHTVGRLHRFLLDAPKGYDVDHINRNRLDNRLSNLRVCTRSQNNMNKIEQSNNTSGCRGVSWSKSNNKWQSRITINKKTINLGYFDNLDDAIYTRKQAEIQYFKEYNSCD